ARGHAQTERFELGRRLRAFEAVWQRQTDAEARSRALRFLQAAADAFLFKFYLGEGRQREAAHDLDRARFALLSDKEPPAAVLWAESLFWDPESRFIDTAATALPVTLLPYYPVKAELPKAARLRLTLLAATGKPALVSSERAITRLPLQAELPLKDIPEGDHQLQAEVIVAGKVLVHSEQTLSCAGRLSPRLQALYKAVAAWPKASGDTQKETVRRLADLLERLSRKQLLETSYPAARLLAEAEAAARTIAGGKPFYGCKKRGQFWLTLALGKQDVPARLAVPEQAAAGKPMPLVIVIHGTGGSENMFFDAHGPGLLARLCRQRGWLLVAPRSSFAGPPSIPDVLAEVDKLYPVDRKRVFLLGHSIGATHAVNVAQKTPKRFAGVAALSPAGASVRPSKDLVNLPIFIGVGTEDFLMKNLLVPGNAATLRKELDKAGARKVCYREYPGVEHLTVVLTGLPDAFAFFDRAAKR
ncbi:MAG TPA: alpha/beta fold hydrolase, partial [Gemmataceae bacterium]|nr:alpha/beta fold hydrolase [Gemmataceae bacterium]